MLLYLRGEVTPCFEILNSLKNKAWMGWKGILLFTIQFIEGEFFVLDKSAPYSYKIRIYHKTKFTAKYVSKKRKVTLPINVFQSLKIKINEKVASR